MASDIYVGCAGWRIPIPMGDAFPGDGTHLERVSRLFNAVEINSSFYKPHRDATWARWAASVPPAFRFSVKVPRAITHDSALNDLDATRSFLASVSHLGEKLGALLV